MPRAEPGRRRTSGSLGLTTLQGGGTETEACASLEEVSRAQLRHSSASSHQAGREGHAGQVHSAVGRRHRGQRAITLVTASQSTPTAAGTMLELRLFDLPLGGLGLSKDMHKPGYPHGWLPSSAHNPEKGKVKTADPSGEPGMLAGVPVCQEGRKTSGWLRRDALGQENSYKKPSPRYDRQSRLPGGGDVGAGETENSESRPRGREG